MKVSDLMLDMSTGNASIEDAYIQEAFHKIKVSSGIFQAAYDISELEEDEVALVQDFQLQKVKRFQLLQLQSIRNFRLIMIF